MMFYFFVEFAVLEDLAVACSRRPITDSTGVN